MPEYKVTKKYGKYAIVKDVWDGKWFIVDVENSCTLDGSYYLSGLKWKCEELVSGGITPDLLQKKWNYDYLTPIDMPQSLKKEQVKILSGKQSAKPGIAKPIGSKAPSIVKVTDVSAYKGAYKVIELSDGTFGTFVPSSGMSKLGFSSYKGASMAGSKAAKKSAGAVLDYQGVDAGSNAVDTLINLYENRVRDMYGQAASEMADKLTRYMASFQSQQAEMIAKYDAGEITQAQLKSWYESKSATVTAKSQLVDTLAGDLAKADQRAADMLNGYMPAAYAENFNFATFQIESATGISTSFQLYNRDAINQILLDPDRALLPPMVDMHTDVQWAKRKISSAIAQSILQGESVPAAAARLSSVVGMGANSAVRAARTALTGAQNYGRLQAGRRAQDMGIELEKQWVATYDSRTRHSHRQNDRETVEVDMAFSNGCMYPGDPDGMPQEVYNCRCAMRYVVPGHEYDDLPDYTKEGEEYEKWKNAKELDTEAKKEKYQKQLDALEADKGKILSTLPEDKAYSGIWKDDVKLSEYQSKIGSIPKKEQYYKDKIASAPDGVGGDMIKQVAQKNLDKLAEYEKLGKEYAEAKAAVQGQLDAIDAQKKEIGEKLSKLIGRNDYSDERKAAAYRWASKKEADDVLRSMTERAWAEATRAEKDAVWGYTAGSGKYNRPLSGFDRNWGEYNFRGVGNVDLNNEGAKQEIRDMTNFISRNAMENDVWLRRGCGYEAMDSFFGTSFGTMARMSDEELQGLVGHSNRIAGFVSCGTASESGAGFGGSVDMRIFVPKGTNATYAEPYSAYSGAGYNGRTWDGIKKQTSFGSEDETIIQRGASFTCTRIERRYGQLHVELEVHPEDGYDLFGQFD